MRAEKTTLQGIVYRILRLTTTNWHVKDNKKSTSGKGTFYLGD